jgi:hypothetical protein
MSSSTPFLTDFDFVLRCYRPEVGRVRAAGQVSRSQANVSYSVVPDYHRVSRSIGSIGEHGSPVYFKNMKKVFAAKIVMLSSEAEILKTASGENLTEGHKERSDP